ncbi:FKBP-type peptidyl-prolyl cis-trans isomerase [Sphingobacterium faecale]|nr:FKBP-type peptidyl-prolyl cis-trans isomerase [Sphingobacterium faecale]
MKFKVICALAMVSGASLCIANAQTKSKKQPVRTQSNSKSTGKTASKGAPVTNTIVLKTEKDSLSYALGTDIAKSLKGNGFNLDLKMLSAGISAYYKGTDVLLTEDKSAEIIQASVRKMMEQKNAELRKPGEEFLAKNKLNPNIKVTEEGVQYEVLAEGEGAHPTVSDEVLVHYLGTLPNGEKFDSSYDRNEALSLRLTGVIKGWQIGIPLMKVGSKYRFFIPYNLAYGERGTGGIPPFSPLIFEVELLEIKSKDAAE